MPLPDDLRMRDATPDDLAAIAALRASVGWAAHDWALRFVLESPEARCFLVEDGEGVAVGVGSGVSYGPLGVVGNMVVAEPHRRRGVGRAILDAVVDDLRERGGRRIELYATPDGRPLYAGAGFERIEPGSRVELPRSAPLSPDPAIEVTEGGGLDEIAAFDAPRFGADRRSLLDTMVRDPERSMLVARREGAVAGFAWLRTDGERLGPFVADDPDVAATLTAAGLERLPGAAVLTFNLPMSNSEGLAWLRRLGVEPDPWDGRMALGPPLPRRESTIYSNAVGALG